jgi:hypothetical protein
MEDGSEKLSSCDRSASGSNVEQRLNEEMARLEGRIVSRLRALLDYAEKKCFGRVSQNNEVLRTATKLRHELAQFCDGLTPQDLESEYIYLTEDPHSARLVLELEGAITADRGGRRNEANSITSLRQQLKLLRRIQKK